MPKLPAVFSVFLLLLLSIHCAFAVSATPTNQTLPSKAEIEQAIANLKGQDATADEKEQAESLYRQALNNLDAIDSEKVKAKTFASSLDQAATNIATFQKKARTLKASEATTLPQNISHTALESQFQLAEAEKLSLRNRAQELHSNIAAEQSFDIPQALVDAREEFEQVSETVVTKETGSGKKDLIAAAKQVEQQTNHALKGARVNTLEQRLLSRSTRLALMNAEQELVQQQLAVINTKIDLLQNALAEIRQASASQIAAEAKRLDSLPSEALGQHGPPLKKIAATNSKLAQRLESFLGLLPEISQQVERSQTESEKLTQQYSRLEQQFLLKGIENSAEFGVALRQQRDWLLQTDIYTRSLKKYDALLTKASLVQLQIDEIEQPRSVEILENLRTKISAENSANTAQVLTYFDQLLENRQLLLNELKQVSDKLILALKRALAAHEQLTAHNRRNALLIDEHLLWIPSNESFGITQLIDVPLAFFRLFSTERLQLTAKTFGQRLEEKWHFVLFASLILALLIGYRRRLHGILKSMEDKVGKVNHDGILHTFIAIGITALLALPGPLLMAIFALLLWQPESFPGGIAIALLVSAVQFGMIGILLQACKPNSIAELHYHWKPNTIKNLSRNLPWLLAILLPCTALTVLLEYAGSATSRDSLGRAIFVTASLGIGRFAVVALHPKKGILVNSSLFKSDQLKTMVSQIALLIPILLAGLSLYGYHYTAVQIEAMMFNSALIVMLLILANGAVLRSLEVSERRIAWRRLKQKREFLLQERQRVADEASGEEQHENALSEEDKVARERALEEEEIRERQQIDMQTLSEHARTLLKMSSMFLLGWALWSVWGDTLPALRALDDVVLWQVSSAADTTIVDSITLWNLLLVIFTIVVTIFSANNLAGTLEVLFFSRLQLAPGASYTITSVGRYIIVLTGLIIVLKLLGTQWAKLQWLVAAMGVGLGFGLQEIVANFVSGLLILFERPIRLGDTVTVGEHTGTVTRIKIRATTIIDWDRKELLIPNKTFITEQLTNWTLTDPITRRIIKVGVAYGSDVDAVTKILLKVAKENKKVTDDPPPAALFLNFGESSLDFELRIFVRGLADVPSLTHEMHMAIIKAMRENHIEIAFPQRDLHIRSLPPSTNADTDSSGINISEIGSEDVSK